MDEKDHCQDCDGTLEARLREQAATFAAIDDPSTEYVRELLEEAAQATATKTCSTCKWWKKEHHADRAGFHALGESSYPSDAPTHELRFCMVGLTNDLRIGISGIDFDYGHIITGPDFGCIHHESEGSRT